MLFIALSQKSKTNAEIHHELEVQDGAFIKEFTRKELLMRKTLYGILCFLALITLIISILSFWRPLSL